MNRKVHVFLFSHTHIPVCLYRDVCLADLIKEDIRVFPAVAQQYDPEMFVSQKHKKKPVEKIEINGKNVHFHGVRFHKLKADSSSLNTAEKGKEEVERK